MGALVSGARQQAAQAAASAKIGTDGEWGEF